jgi:hypothetical protein
VQPSASATIAQAVSAETALALGVVWWNPTERLRMRLIEAVGDSNRSGGRERSIMRDSADRLSFSLSLSLSFSDAVHLAERDDYSFRDETKPEPTTEDPTNCAPRHGARRRAETAAESFFARIWTDIVSSHEAWRVGVWTSPMVRKSL